MPQMSPMKWTLFIITIFLFNILSMTFLNSSMLNVKITTNKFYPMKWKFLW